MQNMLRLVGALLLCIVMALAVAWISQDVYQSDAGAGPPTVVDSNVQKHTATMDLQLAQARLLAAMIPTSTRYDYGPAVDERLSYATSSSLRPRQRQIARYSNGVPVWCYVG